MRPGEERTVYMVYVLLGEGFEEIEAITIADILRRAQIPMQTAGIGGRSVTGAHGLISQADIAVEELDLSDMTAVVLPGGLGGVESIEGSAPAMAAVEYAMKNGRCVAAICAAPTILGKRGWLDGKKATCYPGMESGMGKAVMQPGAKAVVDGQFVTGQAPGAAMEFALTLVEALKDRDTADLVTGFLVYDR